MSGVNRLYTYCPGALVDIFQEFHYEAISLSRFYTCNRYNPSIFLLLPVTSMSKPKGGRGKRASYKTSVVRVPKPIMPQVLELINQFHESSKFTTTKTCPYKKISALSVTTFYNMHYCESVGNDSPYFIQRNLIDEVIWQFDNSFIGALSESASTTLDLLVEYGLIELPENTIACTVPQFIEWFFGQETPFYNIKHVISSAIYESRYDIIKALGILDKSPIDRKEYWHHTVSVINWVSQM